MQVSFLCKKYTPEIWFGTYNKFPLDIINTEISFLLLSFSVLQEAVHKSLEMVPVERQQ